MLGAINWEEFHNRIKQIPITLVLEQLGVDCSGLQHNRRHVLCPVHHESKPSMFVNESSNVCYCFGSCRRFFDPISIWMAVRRVDFKAAADEIGECFGVDPANPSAATVPIVVPVPIPEKEVGTVPELLDLSAAEKYHAQLTDEDRQYICWLFAIDDWAIDYYLLGVKTSSPRAIVIPVLDGGMNGIWNLRFRRDDRFPQPEGMMKYWGIKERNGALPYGIWSLIDNPWVLVNEGEKAVTSLSSYGLPCLTLTTGVSSRAWEDWVYLLDKYPKWVIMFDDDQAGRSATEGMRIKYPGRVIKFPWPATKLCETDPYIQSLIEAQYDKPVNPWGGIDAMDFIHLYGKEAVLDRVEKAFQIKGIEREFDKSFWYGWRDFTCKIQWAVL